MVSLLSPRGAETVPLFSGREGLLCGSCHFDPNGGGPRNELGFGYSKNRHALLPEPEGKWSELDLVNRVGEDFPLYFGVDQRFMAFANTTIETDSLDRFGFFSMESAWHAAFQPHDMLVLVYTRDGFNAESNTKEAFGMIQGLPWNGYVKVGRIRNPFGLRMDDHTVATRNSFTDFSLGQRFLPYDPRQPDMGVEVGSEVSGWFGRAAYTNGGSQNQDLVFFGRWAEAKTVKLGHNSKIAQSGLSFYDNFQKGSFFARETRWGYYLLTHYATVVFIGEVAAGTDDFANDTKTNQLAYFTELNYAPWRGWNFRARFDRNEYDRSTDPEVRKNNTYERYALEGEWMPIPFAEIRWVLRRIDHRGLNGLGEQDDERQAYVQFHFMY
jgi:hypothetical protein